YRLYNVIGARRPPIRFLLQARHDQLLKWRRNFNLGTTRWRNRSLLGMRQHRGDECFFFKHQSAREEPICDTTDGINVGPSIDRFAERHFRRHKTWRAAWIRHVCQLSLKRGVSARFHNSKIEDFYEIVFDAVPADVNVGGFDVAVD